MMKLMTNKREFAALLRNDFLAFIHRSFLEFLEPDHRI